MNIPFREQTAVTSLHLSSCVYSLTLKVLIRTASGKERGKNTMTGSPQERGMKATEAEMILFMQ